MREVIEILIEQLEEHWIKFLTAACFMLVGWMMGKRRERLKWEQRSFLDRLNVSLNSLAENRLRIRTLIEKPGEEVFLNKVAFSRLIKYAEQTRLGEPIIPIPEADRWFYLNSVLNEVSEQFNLGQLAADNQLPVKRQSYLLCLTREAEGDVRTQKIRAMLIRKDQLLALPETAPELERPRHLTRWQTLQRMAQMYQTTPSHFVEIEIVIPLPLTATAERNEPASVAAGAPSTAATPPTLKPAPVVS